PAWHILDAYPFFLADEASGEALPHHWDVTSDSLAVRAAVLARAQELILLKSTAWQGSDWTEATRTALVDEYFATALRAASRGLQTRIVNLRSYCSDCAL